MSYYTRMFIGSNKQEIKVAFDTMTPISLINSQNCEGCNDQTEGFEYQNSYSIRRITDEKITFQVEGEEVKGVLVSDNVNLDNTPDSPTVKSFPFLLVNSWPQNTFELVDGVIGLSKTFYGTNGQKSGPEFLTSLFQSGVISSKIFAVHFDQFGGSTVEFGGYSMDKIVPNVPLTYLEVPFKSTWQVTINAFRIGEKPTFPNGAKSAYYHPEKVAYLDTFSPHIQLPSSLAAQLFADFFHEIQGI
jgi:hypothetical protein